MLKIFSIAFLFFVICNRCDAQLADDAQNIKQLNFFQDSLSRLGNHLINDELDIQRLAANYKFIKTLVTALKTPGSFLFPFDSLKAIRISTSPDNKFRIFSWHVVNDDGSCRFFGAVQMNTGGGLKLYPLEDYTPLFKNPEDTVTDNSKWYGAQYYQIVPVQAANPYYVLLGWKGNTAQSNKRVIDVISFKEDKVQLGLAVFDGKGKAPKRIIFEYARQASMLLRYVSARHLIVFDHLSPPDKKLMDRPETFGPDLTYDGFVLKNGRWAYVDDLDMRNVPDERDTKYIDPKAKTVQ